MTPLELKFLADYLPALPMAAVLILFGLWKGWLYTADTVRRLEKQLTEKDGHIQRNHERYADQLGVIRDRAAKWEAFALELMGHPRPAAPKD